MGVGDVPGEAGQARGPDDADDTNEADGPGGVRDVAPPAESRTLRFPGDRRLGALLTRTGPLEPEPDSAWETEGYAWGRGGWMDLGEARGEVVVPAGAATLLRIDPGRPWRGEPLDLSPLAGLPADALTALDLEAIPSFDPAALAELEREMVHVRGLADLRWLWLSPWMWTDAMLAHVSGLTSLRRLDLTLARERVRDAGLFHLAGLVELRSPELEMVRGATDAGLAHLAGLERLRYLNLRGTGVTDEGVHRLREALPDVDVRW